VPLYLTNTLTQKKQEFKPIGETVKIYICGMTVQGPPHFGHMRAYITSDILVRYLEFLDYKLKVIQNFTDIDDKVIEKSLEEKIDYRMIAKKHIAEYFEVADKMNIKRADFYPNATQHIQEIIELIHKLTNKGYAYESKGDVYFAVEKFADYGKLSKKILDDLIAGARVEVREHKKNPADFTLWKASKPNEPWWESPWGRGRPGWAIECSAMSMHYLGETLDLHLGGEDLIFPHHENEIAQSEAATGKPFVRCWIHNSMLNLTGEKMSKSTKHFITAKELLEKYSPNVIRLYFLKSHYRSPQEFDFKILDANKQAWKRIEEFLYSAEEAGAVENLKLEIQNSKFGGAMDDDLNTPKAIALVFDAVKDGFAAIKNNNIDDLTKKHSEVLFYLRNLGFKTEVKDRSLRKVTVKADTLRIITKSAAEDSSLGIMISEKIVKARDLARNKKQFEISDLIRDGLQEMGFTLEDTDKGTRIKGKS
jgi:cysteinyl-tRNA synthetase